MKPTKTATLLTGIIDLARSHGELRHRHFLIREQIKGLDAQVRENSFFQRKTEFEFVTRHMAESSRADYRRSQRDHGEYLARTRHLEQQELKEIQRLEREVGNQLKQTVSDLRKRIIPG